MATLVPVHALTRSLLGRSLAEVQQDLNRMWDGAGASGWTPAVDVREDDEGIELWMDLPGVPREAMSIELDHRVLTVRGERALPFATEGGALHRVERLHGAFARSFKLPQGIQDEAIQADLKDGVLVVRLPKAAQARRRQIAIGQGVEALTVEPTVAGEAS